MTKTKKGMALLTVGALGVVFGDIGTSPLYALQAAFGPESHHIRGDQTNIFGIISLIIWSVTLVVSIKFIAFIMRVNNEGEGGIMALVSLIKSSRLIARCKWFFILLGLIGVCLFYGDGAITPAISVLSAVEGLKVVAPSFSNLVVPITVIILTALFILQKYGTKIVGELFGPVMVVWFVVIGLGGGWQIWQHPSVLHTLSPLTAISFAVNEPVTAFVALTAVVLAITGVEALYADLGHFGRTPIMRAWFLLVFPALTLCYMGQGALLLHNPNLGGNLLVQMFPAVTRIPVVVLATLATIIASQAVISGAFSLTRQAIQLDFLPKMLVRYTSAREAGQIYVPFVNFMLFVIVILLVIAFGSSASLANAYGIAVSGTIAIDTILFLVVSWVVMRKSLSRLFLIALVFIPIDLLFVASNTRKIWHGGLVPIVIAIVIFLLINTWMKGEKIVDGKRRAMEGSLQSFINKVHNSRPPIKRSPGAAIYISHHSDLVPLALWATLDELHELPHKVVIVLVNMTTAAHVPVQKRAVFDNLGYDDGISHLTLSYGFHDTINVPSALKSLTDLSPELNFNPSEASYFVSLSKVVPSRRHSLSGWRKSIYCLMQRNSLSTSDYYKLPLDRTEEMRTFIGL